MARVSAAPLRDAAGVVRGAVALVADRTERPPTEEALTAALEHERHIAETFQRSLGVPVSEQRFPALDVAMLHQAAWAEARVGGDFCEAFALNAGKVALFVGDVCGKGLEAAIYSGQLKCALRAFLRESPYPAQALFRLNQFICDAQRLDGQTDPVFTVLSLAVLDPASGEAVMSVAGAEPPLALRAAGEAEAITAPCNLPLGVEAGETYGAATLRLERDDTLLLATDGITEARNGGAFLGYEGMVALAGEASRFDSLRERGSAILQGARAFAGGALHDDACLLLARRR